MTNKQTLAALQEAVRITNNMYGMELRYETLRTTVKALIAALEVDVKYNDNTNQEGNVVSRVNQFMSDKG